MKCLRIIMRLWRQAERVHHQARSKARRSVLTVLEVPGKGPRARLPVCLTDERSCVEMRIARFRLNRAVGADAEWLCDLLNRLGAPLGTRGKLAPYHTLTLHPFT
jgi:hypothetical protein